MNKISILIISIVAILSLLLASGCALQSYNDAKDAEKEAKIYEKEVMREVEKIPDASDMPMPPDSENQNSEETKESEPIQRNLETEEGETYTLQKKEDYRRERDVTEKCDLDLPFTCSKYLAKDGIVYLTIKNGYVSKVENVDVSLDGDLCDPSGSFIEPGVRKEFECYVDPDMDLVIGDIQIKYNSIIEQSMKIKEGKVVVQME